MRFSGRFSLSGIAALCLLTPAAMLPAAQIQFTIDSSGTANGLTGIAPTAANRGNYAAGSYLMLSQNISIPLTSSLTRFSSTSATKAASLSSGVFSTGNPGSLTDFFTGTLNVNLDNAANPSSIALTGGSSITGINFNKAYAENPGNPTFSMSPAPGGGTAAVPGTAPADFAVQALFSVGGLPAGSHGTAALRNVVGDIAQTTPLASAPLSGPAGNQSFPTTGNLSLGLTSGTFDYNFPGAPFLGMTVPDLTGSASIGSSTLAPTTDGLAHLTSVALGGGQTLLRLSIPFQTTITEVIPGAETITTSFTFTGSIAAFAIVPEPTTLALVGMGLLCLAPSGVRRWRSARIG